MITFRGGVHPYDGKEYTKDKQKKDNLHSTRYHV